MTYIILTIIYLVGCVLAYITIALANDAKNYFFDLSWYCMFFSFLMIAGILFILLMEFLVDLSLKDYKPKYKPTLKNFKWSYKGLKK